MIDIQGVKINEKNVDYIKIVQRGLSVLGREDDMPWTIKVSFKYDKYTYIGNYPTEEYAQEKLNEMKVL